MGFIKEFKEFALKGNVMDMAVGIIIGGAFGGVVNSMVNDVMMPALAGVQGKVAFNDKMIKLFEDPENKYTSLKAAKDAGMPVIGYGQFITVIINFALVALCVFLLVKAMNTMRRKQAAAPAAAPEPPKQEVLLTEIRDLLAKR